MHWNLSVVSILKWYYGIIEVVDVDIMNDLVLVAYISRFCFFFSFSLSDHTTDTPKEVENSRKKNDKRKWIGCIAGKISNYSLGEWEKWRKSRFNKNIEIKKWSTVEQEWKKYNIEQYDTNASTFRIQG